jgi:hypothetical protein
MVFARRSAVLSLIFGVACSDGGAPGSAAGASGAGAAAGAGGGALAAAGSAGGSGAGPRVNGSSGAATSQDGTGGAASDAGVGAIGGASGALGGSAGAASGGAAGAPADAGSTGGRSTRCAEIEAEYASSFAEHVTCNPAGGDQCQDRIEAAPGCDCLAFIEPKDPFAIERLTNVFIDYLDADCENATCPSPCPSGTLGRCGSDGRCAQAPRGRK